MAYLPGGRVGGPGDPEQRQEPADHQENNDHGTPQTHE